MLVKTVRNNNFSFIEKASTTPRGGATPKLPSPQTEHAITKPVPIEIPQNSVDEVKIVGKVEQVIEPIDNQVNAIESNTVETVTTTTEVTESSGDTVQIIQTHEIKTEITSESEAAPSVDSTDQNKLSEPEMSSEMTGKQR